MTVIIGIDYGRRRVGLAVSDPTGTLASAVGTHRTPEDGSAVDAIARLAVERDAAAVVVGLPLTEKGEAGELAELARAFADRIREATGLPVHLLDERYSSREASAWLNMGGRRRRPKGSIDAVAAEIILQRYLDARPGPKDGS